MSEMMGVFLFLWVIYAIYVCLVFYNIWYYYKGDVCLFDYFIEFSIYICGDAVNLGDIQHCE